MSLSEEDYEEMANVRDTGEFAFNILGPANLKELDIQETLIAQTIMQEESKTSDGPLMIPAAALQLLADENISMKEDMELKLGQIKEYKYII